MLFLRFGITVNAAGCVGRILGRSYKGVANTEAEGEAEAVMAEEGVIEK